MMSHYLHVYMSDGKKVRTGIGELNPLFHRFWEFVEGKNVMEFASPSGVLDPGQLSSNLTKH